MLHNEVEEKDICGGACAAWCAYPENPLFSKEILGRMDKLMAGIKEATMYESDLIKRHIEIFALGLEYIHVYNKKDTNPDPDEVDGFIRKCKILGMSTLRGFSQLHFFENHPQRIALLGLKGHRESMGLRDLE